MSRDIVQGRAQANDIAKDSTVIAAQGAGKTIKLLKATVTVKTAAVGGGGLVELEDGVGGTTLFEADADAVGVYNIDFGDDGYALTANTLLNLNVNGAVTDDASAFCIATAAVYS